MATSRHGSTSVQTDVPTLKAENHLCEAIGDIGTDLSVVSTPCDCSLSETETEALSSFSSNEFCASTFPTDESLTYVPCTTDPVGWLTNLPSDCSNVSIVKSSNVQVGPRLQYNAPVVINQFVTSTSHSLTQTALKATNQGLENVDVVSSGPAKVLTVNGSSPLLEELWTWRVLKLSLVVTSIIVVVCIILAVALTLTSSAKQNSFSEPPVFPAPPDEVNPNQLLPGGHRIFSKLEWGGRPTKARAPDEPPFALSHPTLYVLVSHTAGNPCFQPTVCSRICRDIQDDHMGGNLDIPDIAFNFMLGGDGNVYEGRGWDLTNARTGLNGLLKRKNIDICFLGNFVHDEPTKGQLNAARELLEWGVREGKLSPDYKLFSHNDTAASISPGKNIFLHIKDWPHFTSPNELFT